MLTRSELLKKCLKFKLIINLSSQKDWIWKRKWCFSKLFQTGNKSLIRINFTKFIKSNKMTSKVLIDLLWWPYLDIINRRIQNWSKPLANGTLILNWRLHQKINQWCSLRKVLVKIHRSLSKNRKITKKQPLRWDFKNWCWLI